MKKNVVLGCVAAMLLFVGGTVNAQTFAEVEKPTPDNPWSIETNISAGQAGINWNEPALRARYFFNENWAARVQLGLGDGTGSPMSFSRNFYENVDGTGEVGTLKISGAALVAQIGAEYHFLGTRKLDPYAALGINFGGGTRKTVGTDFDGIGYNPAVQIEEKEGHSLFGADLGLGMDFFFVENVYVGLELGAGFIAKNTKDGTGTQTIDMGGGTTVINNTFTAGKKEAFMSTYATFRIGWRF